MHMKTPLTSCLLVLPFKHAFITQHVPLLVPFTCVACTPPLCLSSSSMPTWGRMDGPTPGRVYTFHHQAFATWTLGVGGWRMLLPSCLPPPPPFPFAHAFPRIMCTMACVAFCAYHLIIPHQACLQLCTLPFSHPTRKNRRRRGGGLEEDSGGHGREEGIRERGEGRQHVARHGMPGSGRRADRWSTDLNLPQGHPALLPATCWWRLGLLPACLLCTHTAFCPSPPPSFLP